MKEEKFNVGDYVERIETVEEKANGSNIYKRLGIITEQLCPSVNGFPGMFRVFNPFFGRSFEELEDQLQHSVGEFAQETRKMQDFPPKWEPRFKKGDAIFVKAIVTDVEYGRFGYKIVTDSLSPETFVYDGGDEVIRPYHKSV